MSDQQKLHFNKRTGDVKMLTPIGARLLGANWRPAQYIKDRDGKTTIRCNLDFATIDISENGDKQVTPHGNSKPN